MHANTIGEPTVCTNTTTVTCVEPGLEPAGSPLSNTLPVLNVEVSSFLQGSGGVRAIDGNQFTSWDSEGGVPQWIKLDLGTSQVIGGIGIFTTNDHPLDFEIQYSTDGSNYRKAAKVRNAIYKDGWNVTLFTPVDARWVKLDITKSSGSRASAFEVKVYRGSVTPGPAGPPAGAATLDLLPILIIVAVIAAAAAVLYTKRAELRLWWQYRKAK